MFKAMAEPFSVPPKESKSSDKYKEVNQEDIKIDLADKKRD